MTAFGAYFDEGSYLSSSARAGHLIQMFTVIEETPELLMISSQTGTSSITSGLYSRVDGLNGNRFAREDFARLFRRD